MRKKYIFLILIFWDIIWVSLLFSENQFDDMSWFFERFGKAEYLYQTKIDNTSFTEKEYEILIKNVEFENFNTGGRFTVAKDSAIALKYSLYKFFKDNPESEKYFNFKSKLYAKEFILKITKYLRREIIECLPAEFKSGQDTVITVQDDLEILKTIISNEELSLGLQVASSKLRDNLEIVIFAVNKNGENLKYVSDRLKNNSQIVKMAIKNSPDALQYTSYELKNNKEIVRLAVEQKYETFQYASDELKSDERFIQSLIKNTKNKKILNFVSPNIYGKLFNIIP
jgi:hypothetical protein